MLTDCNLHALSAALYFSQTAMRVFEYLSASEAPDAFAFEYLIKALR
jgi:hypothetical protein